MAAIVRHGPWRSQRRPEVRIRCRRHSGAPARVFQAARELDVLHQRLVGIAADRSEERTLDEDALVAGGDSGQPRTGVHHRGDQREHAGRSGNRHVETSPATSGSHHLAQHGVHAAVGQLRIGMQEQEHVAGGRGRSGVHLRGASGRRLEGTVGQRRCQCQRRVRAAAVDDDHIVSGRAHRLQRCEGRDDAAHFVARGNDDRNAHAVDAATRARRRNSTLAPRCSRSNGPRPRSAHRRAWWTGGR